jgi:hypothetical protein
VKSQVREGGAIELAGPPHKLSGLIPHALTQRIVPLALQLQRELTIVEAHARAWNNDTVQLRLKLPRDTAAGTYRGEATLGGQTHAVVLAVEPVLDLRVQPKQTRLDSRAKAEFSVEVTNRGNVAFDIDKSFAFDLDDNEGQGRALGRALRARLSPDESRVDRFFEELRADHGGEARVTIIDGSGTLEPAATRLLRCRLELPDDVRAGRTYTGAWKLGNTAHVIVVTLADVVAKEKTRS